MVIFNCHCFQMYVILGFHLKCNFGLMVKFIIVLHSDNPTDFLTTYLISFNLITIKAAGDFYVL